MRKILAVEDLKISFSKVQALRGVSFSLFEGESLAIVGESGSGKSVLARALMGLNVNETSTGKVIYQEINLLDLKEDKLRAFRGKEIGMIFQDPMASLNPTMIVGRQVQENLPHATIKPYDRVIELFKLVGIPEPEKRYNLYPYQLSGGMRQRVMIAIALAGNPKILIADEPTTALDVTIQAQILDLLQNIQREMKMSIIFITHDLSLVAGFCSRILVMYGGVIVENARVERLFKDPGHPYTKKLLRALPRLDHKPGEPLIPIEGSPPRPSEGAQGCAFFPRCGEGEEICETHTPALSGIDEEQEIACWVQIRKKRHDFAAH